MHDLKLPDLNVSRETIERLEAFCAQLARWSAKINLIAPADSDTIWRRHIVDSAQLFGLRHAGNKWCDLGSGGGLPAVVLAIMAQELAPQLQFELVESDARKAAFLRVIRTELALNYQVHNARAEALRPMNAQTVSARALAPLDKLLGYVDRHLDPAGVALLPKGRNHEAEIAAARKNWSFELDLAESVADEGARILCITQIHRIAGSA